MIVTEIGDYHQFPMWKSRQDDILGKERENQKHS